MADPISMAVGTAVLTSTGSFAVASAAVTAFWATAATVALNVAVSSVVADRQRRARQNSQRIVGDDRSLQQSIPEPAPEHYRLYGYAFLAGTPFFLRGGEENRPYLYRGVALAGHECDGLDSVWINGTRVLIGNDGFATSTPFNDGVTQFIKVSFRSGTLTQAIDSILSADFSSLPSTYRQLGTCTAVIKAHYGTGANRDEQEDKHRELFGDGEFVPLWRVRGAKIYDPRDVTQSLGDPSTWQWSRNAALVIADYLVWKYPSISIDWDRIAEAADICDLTVRSKAGEAFAQFTMDGVIRAGDPPQDVINDLLSSCGGRLIRQEGKYHVRPAQIETPVGTIHAGNLRGGIQFNNGLPVGQLVNELKPEFFSPERGYKMVPGPVISVPADVTADGERRSRSERYPFTETSPRAQRLASIEYKEGRIQQTVTLGVDLSAFKWAAGRTVMLDLAQFNPVLTGQWRILNRPWSDGLGGYTLQLKKYDASVMDFDPATDEQDFEIDEDSDL